MATTEYEVDGEEGTAEFVHIDGGIALTAADKAQIDIQIATAKRYPRDIAKCQREAVALATMDPETANSMHYALPRKSRGKTTFIEGPSVRAAEILVYTWGNVRAEARIVGADDTHVTAQGTCMDLEKNVAVRLEVKRRITGSDGKRYSEDMIVATGNAAGSIAFRNAVFRTIPAVLAKKFLDAAKKLATGGAQPIEARRQNALAWFARVGAHEKRVLDLLNVETVDEITEEHLSLLVGLKNAIMEGSTTIEDAFGNSGEKVTSAGTAALNEKLKETEQPQQGEAEPPRETKVRATLHGKYMAAVNARAPKCPDDVRHDWQLARTGKASTSQWAGTDYAKAMDLIESGDYPGAETETSEMPV